MYAALAVIVQVIISLAAAALIAPRSIVPIATSASLANLCMASAALSGIGFVATAKYLSRSIRARSGVLVGVLCGALCSAMLGLVLVGIDFSLILYLALLTPTLLAVLLASLLDKPRSGWQS